MNVPVKVRILNLFRALFKVPMLESYLASRTAGLPPDHWICKLVPNPYQYVPETFRNVNRDGVSLRVDISDYIGHYLYFGFADPAMKKLFALCGESSTAIDVGANIGWTVLLLARIAKKGTVWGFEPEPRNFEDCQTNIKLNSFGNVTLFPIGLGDANGRVLMEIRTPSNRGGNRVALHPGESVHQVEVARLDDFGPASKLVNIDLIKIDVEGYELQVLRGAEKMLRKHRPALFIEVDENNLRDQGDSAEELVRFIMKVGYREIVRADDDSQVSATTKFDNCHFDIIARQ